MSQKQCCIFITNVIFIGTNGYKNTQKTLQIFNYYSQLKKLIVPKGVIPLKTKSRVESWLPRTGFSIEFGFLSASSHFSVTADCTVLRGALLLR